MQNQMPNPMGGMMQPNNTQQVQPTFVPMQQGAPMANGYPYVAVPTGPAMSMRSPVMQQPTYPAMQDQPAQLNPSPVDTPQFIGRFINDPNEIMPRDVPMDGRITLFPTKDLNAIYLKYWTPEGKLAGFRYIVDPNQTLSNVPEQDFQQQVFGRLNAIEAQLRQNQNGANLSQSQVKEEGGLG